MAPFPQCPSGGRNEKVTGFHPHRTARHAVHPGNVGHIGRAIGGRAGPVGQRRFRCQYIPGRPAVCQGGGHPPGSAVVICRSDDPEAASPACTNTSARGWADGWIVYEERDGADGLGGGDKLLRIQAPLTGVDGASSAKTDFTFTPLGRSQSASVNVVFGVGIPPERRRKICIGFTGRARLAADASADCNS